MKKLNKKYKHLDARQKAWATDQKVGSKETGVSKRLESGGYRKPGSMKGRS